MAVNKGAIMLETDHVNVIVCSLSVVLETLLELGGGKQKTKALLSNAFYFLFTG